MSTNLEIKRPEKAKELDNKHHEQLLIEGKGSAVDSFINILDTIQKNYTEIYKKYFIRAEKSIHIIRIEHKSNFVNIIVKYDGDTDENKIHTITINENNVKSYLFHPTINQKESKNWGMSEEKLKNLVDYIYTIIVYNNSPEQTNKIIETEKKLNQTENTQAITSKNVALNDYYESLPKSKQERIKKILYEEEEPGEIIKVQNETPKELIELPDKLITFEKDLEQKLDANKKLIIANKKLIIAELKKGNKAIMIDKMNGNKSNPESYKLSLLKLTNKVDLKSEDIFEMNKTYQDIENEKAMLKNSIETNVKKGVITEEEEEKNDINKKRMKELKDISKQVLNKIQEAGTYKQVGKSGKILTKKAKLKLLKELNI